MLLHIAFININVQQAALQDQVYRNPGSQTVQSERVKAGVGYIKTFLLREKCSRRAGGKQYLVMALSVQHKGGIHNWCVFGCWLWKVVLGTGLGTTLTVIRGLSEETSNISGNYSLALTWWEVPVKALWWVLLSGAEYWSRWDTYIQHFLRSADLLHIYGENPNPALEGTSVQTEKCP